MQCGNLVWNIEVKQMNKNELVQELLKYFLKEGNYSYEIPSTYDEKRALLRGLINVRETIPIKEEILKLEDELLQIEIKEKGIVDGVNLSEVDENMSLYLGDLTTLKVDVIVNAGNSSIRINDKYAFIPTEIKEKSKSYINEEFAWNDAFYDIYSLASFYTGHYKEAIELVKEAINLNPYDERYQKNLELMTPYSLEA